MTGTGAGCPAPESLAAMAEGTVSRRERATLVAHLARCPDCHEILAEAVRFVDEQQTEANPGEHATGRGRWGWITSLAAAACVVVGVWFADRLLLPSTPMSSPDQTPAGKLTAVPSWTSTPPWEGSTRQAFAAPSSEARSVWVGLHLGTLDGVCQVTDEEIAKSMRRRVASSLGDAVPEAWVNAVAGSRACRNGRAEMGTLPLGIDVRWVTLGRTLERLRIAAIEHKADVVADGKQDLERLTGELPLTPAALKVLQRTSSQMSPAPKTPTEWGQLRETVLDSVYVLTP